MRRYSSFLLLLTLLLATAASAQTAPQFSIPATGRQLADFIPCGYQVLRRGQVNGDLNHDGRPDVALVLGSVAEDTTQFQVDLPARQLLLLSARP